MAAMIISFKKEMKTAPNFNSIGDAKKYVDDYLAYLNRKHAQTLLIVMLKHFGFSDVEIELYRRKWRLYSRKKGRIVPPEEFAPYAFYVFKVDYFFKLVASQELVPTGKKSKSYIDLQYIYYLPFCMCFASKDKFHKKVAPLFMETDQSFVWGDDLKADLSNIHDHLSADSGAEYDGRHGRWQKGEARQVP
ncbi:MAG: hypothetical protein MK052_11770 [Alphaproteobacteria bacterium]|nr:hypothetical protein [Alphaproteobacteria bacterium]